MKFDTSLSLLQRLSFIETRLAWTGAVHAGEVAEYFHVTRQTAQGFINAYRKAYPGQMTYDPKRKRHVRTTAFVQQVTKKETLRFLDFIRGQALVGKYWVDENVSEVPIIDVDRLARPELSKDIVQTILTGLTDHKRVSIRYQSKVTDPLAISYRMISPNHLVHADNRYHVRAFYHKNNVYRDFVLSRIHSAELQSSEKPDSEWVSGEDDTDWATQVTLKFTPHPKLNLAQRQAVTEGYRLDADNCYQIQTNRAQAFYVKRKMLMLDLKINLPRWCFVEEKKL
jgi:predicted DNA-binding transcriptional regulator YafY